MPFMLNGAAIVTTEVDCCKAKAAFNGIKLQCQNKRTMLVILGSGDQL